MQATVKAKKITLTTVKSFIRKNQGKLLVSFRSSFDGMVDGVRNCENREFREAKATTNWLEHSHGVEGAWFVGSSRDYFTAYDDGVRTGIEVSNCCGHFILAVAK